VQLTLATNTRPRGFTLAMVIGSMLAPLLGFGYVVQYRSFSMLGDYAWFVDSELQAGFDSAHYESLRGPRDRLRPVPMIASDQVSNGFVRLFIPYYPTRDNPRLAEVCPNADGGAACLRQLWRVQLDGVDVALDGFDLAQRSDLGMRGLVGYVALPTAEPGQHRLVLRRTVPADDIEVEADATHRPISSRSQRRVEFTIPFLFAPEPRG
jgi:hypothetical protein